jgi:hypothetical protein
MSWEADIVVYFIALSCNLLEGVKNTKILCYNSLKIGRVSDTITYGDKAVY